MPQINPKQVDWSLPISGSLIPSTGSGEIVSSFSLGSPSASWESAYIQNLQTSGSIVSPSAEFDEILVRNKTELRTETFITGSLKISGSIELSGSISIENLGELGNREDNLIMDLGGFF
jgi:hypothetical protein